jgi:arsenate reductase (glutaredoxin)
MPVVIYHNPSCGTSRKVLGFIRDAGIEPDIVLYLKDPPTKSRLVDLLARMKLSPRDILRRRGTPYDELGLGNPNLSDADLLEAMVKNPILIERPIVVTDRGVALCRPPELVQDLLSEKPSRSSATKADAAEAPPVSDKKVKKVKSE